MILTIEVSEEVAERLRNEARAEGRSPEDLAADTLAARFATAPMHDPELVEAIREGLADIAAGRTISLEEFIAQRRAERGALTPSDALSFWKRNGLLSGYGNAAVDAQTTARELREQAGNRVW